jgi:SAM-dependent methyltransferase
LKCRHCGGELGLSLIDLGSAPPSNAYLTEAALNAPERWYPLRVLVCEQCWLVQTEDYTRADELFGAEYAYFSSYSAAWLEHARRYVTMAVDRFGLDRDSHVIEIAANDGYLLQYFTERGIPNTGIEPTAATAAAARQKGLEIIEDFFGVRCAQQMAATGKEADLMVANNVLAHVPDINDFVRGFAALLKPKGVATFEFPHLVRLVQETQFDTIYHEHYSYLSLTAVAKIFASNGLSVFDVEELPTHGGSLRVYAQRTDSGGRASTASVKALLDKEEDAGVLTQGFYEGFQKRAEAIKDDLVEFLIQSKRSGKRVAAYGAAAKGNTLLNYSGVRPDLIEYVVDRNPAKQGKYMPGSRIPIVEEDWLRETKPDFVVLLPWNLMTELMEQLQYTRSWGAKFVCAIPSLVVG